MAAEGEPVPEATCSVRVEVKDAVGRPIGSANGDIRIAGVDMDNGCAGFPGPDGILNDLLGCNREMGRHARRMNASGNGCSYYGFLHIYDLLIGLETA